MWRNFNLIMFTKKAAVISSVLALALSGCGNSSPSSEPVSTSSSSAESKLDSSDNNISTSEAVIESTPHEEVISKRNSADDLDLSTESKSGESAEVYGKYQAAAEKSVDIITSIERENINALVNVYLIDFTFDGVPEVVVSYDTGSGHSYVENDVYGLQDENSGKIFSFCASGISRDYAPSIFLYEDENSERFFAFDYGLDSGNYLKLDYVDKLELADGKYVVSNIFSSTIAADQSLYSNEFIYSGIETDKITFEQEKSKWLSNLRECAFCRVEVPIKAAEWSDDSALMKRFETAFADFDNKTH